MCSGRRPAWKGVAGVKGEFEQRLKNVIDAVSETPMLGRVYLTV
ncbi:hypothetical protein [Pseudomonas sp. EA_15y_Pfl2_R67]